MGCLIGKEEKKENPLKTEDIYSLIFKDFYIDKQERSKSDSEFSYKRASPEIT